MLELVTIIVGAFAIGVPLWSAHQSYRLQARLPCLEEADLLLVRGADPEPGRGLSRYPVAEA